MHEVEAAAELDAGGEHVLVHVVDPRDERVEVVAREVRLADAVDDHAVAVLDRLELTAAAGDDVDLVAVAHELLGELADVPCQPALDDRRVLPREGQDAHGGGSLAGQRQRASRCAAASAQRHARLDREPARCAAPASGVRARAAAGARRARRRAR